MKKSVQSLTKDILSLLKRDQIFLNRFDLNPKNINQMKPLFQHYVENSIKCGIVETFYYNNQLHGFFFMGRTNLAQSFPCWYGNGNITGQHGSTRWFFKMLAEHSHLFDNKTVIDVPFTFKKQLTKLEKIGFHIESVRAIGTPATALKKLAKHIDQKDCFENRRLIFTTPKINEIPKIIDIEQKEYSRNPQYGWFMGEKIYRQTSLWKKKFVLKDKESSIYVIKKNKKILGSFSVFIRKSPMWGILGQCELLLDQSIQKQGLSKLIYRQLLLEMISKKVRYFSGNTAQGPVLHLNKIMGRKISFYTLKFGKTHFSTSHFHP